VHNATLLTIYGRQFNDTPILGRLGFDKNYADLRRQVAPFWQGMHTYNGGKSIHVALHLIYAIATPGRSFNMFFNTANVLRATGRSPGGTLMVYSGADLARALEDVDDAEVARRYVEDLVAIFPPVRDAIEEVVIKRWPRGLPHPRPRRRLLQPGLERRLGNIFLAGDYLGTTYVETAVQTGTAAAQQIRSLLARSP